MFFLEWINDYYSTPRAEMTKEIEMLGIAGIGILAVLILAALAGLYFAISGVKHIADKAVERKRKEDDKGDENS